MVLLTTKRLGVRYGAVEALQPLTLEVPEGSWALLGPNGAGKSTLIRTMLGLTRPTQGGLRVLGMDPGREATALRRRIGYMPESPALIPGMTGFQYVRLAARLNGLEATKARQAAHIALDEVGLGEARYRSVEGYSTGMRQRAKLAQAIVHDPELLILDEPTNGLDPEGREHMLELIRHLAGRGHHLIISSHILPEVRRVTDQAVILRQGEVVHQGALDALKVDLGGFMLEPLDDPRTLISELEAMDWGVRREGDRIVVEGAPDLQTVLRLAARTGVALRAAGPHEREAHDVVVDFMEDRP